ncbi:aldehyde dehydrogenase [Kribbella sp. NPDC051620]|uniref:aldehyde dehydrogenase n=1 Tax=Kribbella sp. NPDC051620 TaxID=3364120 RepID=UPI0037BA8F26
MTDNTLASLHIDLELKEIFAGGEWRPSHSDGRVALVNPATEETFGHAPDGDAEDIDTAVRAARSALLSPEWADTTPKDRAVFLRGIADRLTERASEIGDFVTNENGVIVGVTTGHALASAGILRYYADMADNLELEERRGNSIVRREPVGVAGLIVPWNAPLLLAFMKLAPALLAGCTTVIKPAAETALSAAFIVDAAQAAGLPAGVVNVVTGDRETGQHLVGHPDVDKIAFTGSTAAGRAIAAECGRQMRPGTFELGGKSAAILLDDVDLGHFLSQLMPVSLGGCGQVCRACTRLLVARSRYDELKEGLVATLSGLTIGDPHDPATAFGPLAMERQRDRVEEYIRLGLSEGAELLIGGGRPAHLSKGFYVEPTIFTDVDNSSRIAQEEIFGPVLTVTPFDTVDEAVEMANASEYGLAGTVFTADSERGVEVARRIEAGTVGINGYVIDSVAPFGGHKQSGLGSELGPEGLNAYLQYKSIYQPTA